MKINYKDFVGYYYDVYPEGFCRHLINEFDRLESSGCGHNRQQSENSLRHFKDDYQITLNLRNHSLLSFEDYNSEDMYFKGLQKCFDHYSNTYSTIKNLNVLCTTMKLQRTGSGGGYHVWHCEQGNNNQANRILTFILYLNSLVNEGGETELLYQKTRVPPIENSMIIFPASFTHTHRGNPVLSENNKYIVTGWFYLD